MAVKTFSVGELATSADVNTYLANSGLVWIKEQTVGTGVSGVNVTDAFSASFDHYRIIMSGVDCSTGDYAMGFFFGTYGATGYYNNMEYYKIGSGRGDLPSNNTQSVYVSIQGTENDTMTIIDILNPYQAQRTMWSGSGFGWLSTYNFSGMLANTTSYTSFQIFPGYGTISGGKVTVYGYRKA